MYRSSPLRSTLNTNVITGLDMCKVCTEAVDAVQHSARHIFSESIVRNSTTLPRDSGPKHLFRLHFRETVFPNSITLARVRGWHPANSATLPRAPNQPDAKKKNPSRKPKAEGPKTENRNKSEPEEDRKQKAENRKWKAKNRKPETAKPKAESRRPKAGNRKPKTERETNPSPRETLRIRTPYLRTSSGKYNLSYIPRSWAALPLIIQKQTAPLAPFAFTKASAHLRFLTVYLT